LKYISQNNKQVQFKQVQLKVRVHLLYWYILLKLYLF